MVNLQQIQRPFRLQLAGAGLPALLGRLASQPGAVRLVAVLSGNAGQHRRSGRGLELEPPCQGAGTGDHVFLGRPFPAQVVLGNDVLDQRIDLRIQLIQAERPTSRASGQGAGPRVLPEGRTGPLELPDADAVSLGELFELAAGDGAPAVQGHQVLGEVTTALPFRGRDSFEGRGCRRLGQRLDPGDCDGTDRPRSHITHAHVGERVGPVDLYDPAIGDAGGAWGEFERHGRALPVRS